MAPKQQQPTKPTGDPYTRRASALSSQVQRLRGWVDTDPARLAELADALVELTAHRLRGHAFAAAGPDAQEAVKRSAALLTAPGPIGPYTATPDAVRYLTALVHLVALQLGVGLTDAAGRTVALLRDARVQLRDFGVEQQLAADTAVWALAAEARTALAAGRIDRANAAADAALARLTASGLADDSEAGFLPVDVDRVVADCRWAAGRTADAIGALHTAADRYEALAGDPLRSPGQLGPARLERLVEPLPGLYTDLADRLVAVGEADLGLVTRRRLVDRLRAVAGRLGAPTAGTTTTGTSATGKLAVALGDLAVDLERLGRADEADATRAEAARVVRGRSVAPGVPTRERVPAGPRIPNWGTLSAEEAYGAPAAQLVGPMAVAEAAVDEHRRDTEAWLRAERDEAHRAEERRQREAREQAARHQAELTAAERAEAERRAAEAERAAEEKRADAERRAAAEAAETKRRREERLESHRLEVEEREAARRTEERAEAESGDSELASARLEWQEARASGDRRRVRLACERVVELLRPRAMADLARYGPELRDALEQLSSARLRGGDVWGSRAPAKEAKALTRALDG